MNLARMACAPLFVVAGLSFSLAIHGCGGVTCPEPCDGTTSTSNGAGAGNQGGGGNASSTSSSSGDACKLDPAGSTFTFHVVNTGSQKLRLAYSCGQDYPIELDTPRGTLPIGPGDASYCDTECKAVYAGKGQTSCSDCGPGYGALLDPGMKADIQWDRLGYKVITASKACSPKQAGMMCTLGETVAPSAKQHGGIVVCTDGGPNGGYCATSAERMVSFVVDTTAKEGTINVQ